MNPGSYYTTSVPLLEREGKLSLCLMNPCVSPEVSAVQSVGDADVLFGSFFSVCELGHSQSCSSYGCTVSWEINVVI